MRIRTTSPPPSAAGTCSRRLHGVVVGHPGGPRQQPQRDDQVVGGGAEGALGQVALARLRGRSAVDVEHGELLDAVHAEHPGVLGAVAPALEVPAAVHADDPHRVDVALGGLVAPGHEVAQVHPTVVGDGLPRAGQQLGRRALGDLGAHPAGRAAAAPAASSSLASARSTASRSPRPGTSRSARSPTTRVTASSTPSRRGRAMVSALPTNTRPSSQSASMSSSGIWP